MTEHTPAARRSQYDAAVARAKGHLADAYSNTGDIGPTSAAEVNAQVGVGYAILALAAALAPSVETAPMVEDPDLPLHRRPLTVDDMNALPAKSKVVGPGGGVWKKRTDGKWIHSGLLDHTQEGVTLLRVGGKR